jgi:hypothetical protein
MDGETRGEVGGSTGGDLDGIIIAASEILGGSPGERSTVINVDSNARQSVEVVFVGSRAKGEGHMGSEVGSPFDGERFSGDKRHIANGSSDRVRVRSV